MKNSTRVLLIIFFLISLISLIYLSIIIENDIDNTVDCETQVKQELEYIITSKGDTAWVVESIRVQKHFSYTKPI